MILGEGEEEGEGERASHPRPGARRRAASRAGGQSVRLSSGRAREARDVEAGADGAPRPGRNVEAGEAAPGPEGSGRSEPLALALWLARARPPPGPA